MKLLSVLRTALIHLTGIGGGMVLLLGLLNWYNPNMGIWARNAGVILLLSICAVALLAVSILEDCLKTEGKSGAEDHART